MRSPTRRCLMACAALLIPALGRAAAASANQRADPRLVFLSDELQPALVDANVLASLRQRGLVVVVDRAPTAGRPARVLRFWRPDRPERGE